MTAEHWRCKRCRTELSMTIEGVTFCSQCHRRGHGEIAQLYRPHMTWINHQHHRLLAESERKRVQTT